MKVMTTISLKNSAEYRLLMTTPLTETRQSVGADQFQGFRSDLCIPQMCFLDILDNLPRLRLSSSQMKMILWIMRECGARDVPSFQAFRKMQTHVRDLCGVKTDPSTSDLGNVFFTTDVRDLISRVSSWHSIPLRNMY